MSAELVDPFATPPRERLKTADMCDDITARLLNSEQVDPPLFPQLVQKTLRELRRAADDGTPDALAAWARWLLEQLHHRAISGVSYNEPSEPDWSLDPDPRVPPRERPFEKALSAGDGDLG